jgi:tRNA 5-methylaminomethyl-2-thiouridine biosynthesis bifunctional protein
VSIVVRLGYLYYICATLGAIVALKPAHLQWSDGVLRSLDFDDIYFQPGQGREESYYFFLEQNRLPERFAASGAAGFRIAELGFGSGLNFLLTAQLWHKSGAAGALTYVSIEKHPIPRTDLQQIFSFWPELAEYSAPLLAQYPPLVEGFHHLHFLDKNIHLMLCFGDVAEVLPEVQGRFDVWYLDGFAPAKNPDMWDEKLFPLIAARTEAGGTLATFSSVGDMRLGLQAAGFEAEKIKGFGTKWHMTVAKMPEAPLPRRPAPKNAVVLGAGIAGASAAFALAQKGYEVTVIDRQPAPAMETSGNPLGIVYPKVAAAGSPFGQFHQHGFCFTRNLAVALNLPSWNPCGVLHLDMSADEQERYQALATGGEWPEDFLHYETGRGLNQPWAGYLSPPEFCRALLNHPKIKTRYGTSVSSFVELEGYDAVVLASGQETKNFPEIAWLPLHSFRGQVTYLKPTPQSQKITGVICHEGYITPVVDGVHYIGATFQKENPALPDVRKDDHRENLEKLNRYISGLGFTEDDIAGGRAGYRAMTPDRFPLIGACPDYAGFIEDFAALRVRKKRKAEGKFIPHVYLSTGFGAHGLTGAPLAGEIIACKIAGDPLPIPSSLERFIVPERFILRDLRHGRI